MRILRSGADKSALVSSLLPRAIARGSKPCPLLSSAAAALLFRGATTPTTPVSMPRGHPSFRPYQAFWGRGQTSLEGIWRTSGGCASVACGCASRLQPWRAWSTCSPGGVGAASGHCDSGGACSSTSDASGSRIAATLSTPAASRHGETEHYDVAVIGLGAFGSAVLYHLARAGLKVVGVERHRPVGHCLGSSHGASRIIRLAYFEGLQYGPLLKRSLRLFLELQDELAEVKGAMAEPLFLRTGMLDVGSVFERSLQSARVHGLQHEVLTGEELNRRFPAYRVPEHWRALYQPDGGVLAPERIVQAHVSLAQRLGARVLAGQTVTSWGTEGSSADAPVTFRLTPTATDTGPGGGGGGDGGGNGGDGERGAAAWAPASITAAAAVLAPGPWIGQLVPELRELCVPERQVVGWFEIDAAARRLFAPDRFPVFVLEEAPGGAAYYGFPEHGGQPGFKIGLYRHLRQEILDPAALDRVHRAADTADEAVLRAGVSSYFPLAAGGRMLAASTCFFTNTPDGHFLVDRHPRHRQVLLCSACSGHGFKMSSGIGQLMAAMVLDGLSVARESAPSPLPAPGGGSSAVATSRPGGRGTAGGAAHRGLDDELDPRGWGELLPFRFSPGERPGHEEALARFW